MNFGVRLKHSDHNNFKRWVSSARDEKWISTTHKMNSSEMEIVHLLKDGPVSLGDQSHLEMVNSLFFPVPFP
jgi:hypothetical protein